MKLQPQEAELLTLLIFISRNTKLFSIDQIARSWLISQATAFRYESPKYRELSRNASRRANLAYKLADRTKCQICFEPLKNHSRCVSCEILLHGDPECSCFRISPYVALTRNE